MAAWCFVLISCAVVCGCYAKLNVPRVLLPLFDSFSTNFTLEVTDGGCYAWQTTRPDIIDLIAIDVNVEFKCSTKAVVSISKKSKITIRNTAIILAEEIHSEQVLYCDVIVDFIDTLQIVTTTRELFIEEAPEAFEVRAYDNQGNEFSTLNGVEFQWSITNMIAAKTSDSNPVIRFIKFSDSPYETPASIVDFEKKNSQGHIILLEGVKTGSAKISVKLPHMEYGKLNATEVNLMVVANLILDPSNVCVLRGDVVNYKIYHVHQGRLEEIYFPSSQYFLEIEDKSIAKVIDDSGHISGLNEGKTRVLLHDRNVNSDIETSTRIPSAIITVAKPNRILLSLLPYYNWAVIVGEQHELIVELFSENNEKFYIGSGVGIVTRVEDGKFIVNSCSRNSSWCYGFGNELGKSKVHASLENIISPHLSQPMVIEPRLTTSESIRIYGKIDILPRLVVIPWDHLVKARYEVELKASGGDGKFLWSSNNTGVGTVTQVGLVRIVDQGKFQITASMLTNTHNKAVARFHVVPAISIQILKYSIETPVNSLIYVNIGMYTDRIEFEKTPFSYCQELPFKFHFSDKYFIYNATVMPQSEDDESCATIRILPLNVGSCKFTISYTRNDGIVIEDSVTLTSYKALALIEPHQKYTVLAEKTSRHLIFSGGPKFWSSASNDYSRTINFTPRNSNKVVEATIVSDLQTHDYHVVQVYCNQLGESYVELMIENQYSHAKSVFGVLVVCTRPKTLALAPNSMTQLLSCPLSLSDMVVTEIMAKNNERLTVEVIVKDELGRKFDNFSSLSIDWLLHFETGDEMLSLIDNGKLLDEVRWFDEFVLPGKTLLQLKTYGKSGKSQLDGNLKHGRATINNRVNIHLISSLELVPKMTSLFNHPTNVAKIHLKDGSNFFKVETYPDEIALIQYLKNERLLEVRPLKTGKLTIKVSDLCLSPIDSVLTAEVNIVAIDHIELFGQQYVQLGRKVEIVAKLFDKNNDVIFIPSLESVQLKILIDNDVASVNIVENKLPVLSHINFEVQGLQLGESKVIVEVQQNFDKVSSVPFSIQVFSPLRLMPKSITLLIGSSFQIWTQGGPQLDTNVNYVSDSSSIIEVTENGLVTGLELGYTNISAEITGFDSKTGASIVYSSDCIAVEVIPLKGIRIATPIKRVLKGSLIPIWAVGIPEQINPMVLSSTNPAIRFNWQITDYDVIEMSGIFDEFGVRYDPVDLISARIKALNVGKSIVKLSVVVNERVTGVENGGDDVTFLTYTEIEVFESLELIRPMTIPYREILMTPWTEMKLETNKDHSAMLTYKVQNLHKQKSSNNYSLDVLQASKIVSVTNEGVLKSFSVIGKCSLVITSLDLNSGLTENLIVLVEVKPIFYLVTKSVNSWSINTNDLVKHVPLGTELQFEVDYYDNIGRQFVSTNVQPHTQLNRFDIVTIKAISSQLIAFTQHIGKIVLKVGTVNNFPDSKAVDYIVIHSEQIIRPNLQKVIFGDVICFSTSLVTKDFKKGEWISHDTKLLNLDPNTGVGQVIGMHSDSVSMHYSLTPTSNIHMDILPITKVNIVPSKENITNQLNHVVNIPVVLSTGDEIRSTNLLKGYSCEEQLINATIQSPFLCHLAFQQSNSFEISEMFKTKSKFDHILGSHVCQIIAKSNNSVNTSIIDDYLVLQVFHGSEIESSVKIGFNPLLHFHSTELMLDDDTFSAKLLVTGVVWILDNLKITPVDKRILSVSAPERLSENTHSFKITLRHFDRAHLDRNTWTDALKLNAESKLTNQRVQVIVHTKTSTEELLQPTCATRPHGSLILDAIFGFTSPSFFTIIIIALITAAVYVYPSRIKPTINVNVSGNDSIYNASMSPRNFDTKVVRVTPQNRISSPQKLRTLVYGDDTFLDS